MDKKYIASISFGKDSLAMLIKLIENNKPLDEVVFYDTGMEFEAIYNLRDSILPLLQQKGIKYTQLHPKEPFLYTMLHKDVTKRNGTKQKGYSWCGGVCRWGTTEKLRALEKHCKGHYEYVGIALDEPKRLEKERNGNKLFPLADTFKMTEKECLEFCYSKGYNWIEDGIELYSILKRVSCWNCGNKNLSELRNYHKYLPRYWDKFKELQSKTNRPFRKDCSIFDLEKRFLNESEAA